MSKKSFIATFCIFLIVMLPVCMAQDEFEQEGETLIIEAKQYEPEVLRSDYMEQLNIPVRVILGAIRGEPISLPEINSVSVRLIKKQDAQKKNATVEGTSEQTIKDYVQGTPKWHKAPYPTLENLGYVEITLKKIEKETEVPKQIDLDFEATINYEAEIAGFTIGGENQKELQISTVETIKENSEEYKILGGRYYLRVTDITSTGTSVEVLNPEFARLTSKTLKLGETSSSITLSYKDQAEPDHIRLKLEEVRGVGDINLEFKIGSKLETKTFEKNKEIERGWKISNYYTGIQGNLEDDYIILKNNEFKSPVVLSTQKEFDEVNEIKKLIENCNTNECKIYTNSRIQNLQTYSVNKELLIQSLNSLEVIGLTKFASIEQTRTGRLAKIQIGGLENPFTEGETIGACGCKISSITRDEVRISGIKKCNPNAGNDIETIKTGESSGLCGTVLELRGITTDEKAVITVLPGTGRGKTTTYFSVHIPVEKRAIQYTPEELQEKINRTEALIKKLDGTITQLQTLVEGWTKVCLATMAVFTVMAFMQGVSGTSPKTGTAAGTGTGESTKTEEKKPIVFPEGVKQGNLVYGYDSSKGLLTDKSYPLSSDSTYYFVNGNAMQGSKDNNPIVYVGAKFQDKTTNKWYTLTSEGKIIEGKESDRNWGVGDGSGKYVVSFSKSGDIAVGLQDCNQIPTGYSGEVDYRANCKHASKTYGTALVLEYSKTSKWMAVWSIGGDGKFKTQDDIRAFTISEQSSTFKELQKDLTALEDANKRGEKNSKFRSYSYPNAGTFASGGSSGDVDCRMVMSEGQCKILFNACDPVMCPPSRCNFGGKVRNIDNVIQSGLVGSLLLCLPNIKDGVIMPICLSGVLASLKNIRSVLQGYVDCLKTALNDQKSVGICDRIRSVWMCQILWKEAMSILNLAGGNFFDKAANSGGGEYFTGLKGGVENAKTTVDYFTNSYAKSIFASYTGKSTKDMGAVICEKAIYGKGPLLGDIVEDVTKAQNPTQFTAYVEEEVLYQATEQKSTYKLYYHIYAGAQQIDYKVYVKKSSTGKTYTCKECSGKLESEGYIDKSTLFTLEPGYNVICIKIGSKEECNMGRVVSTSYGINAANNYLTEYELSKEITTEEQCSADVRGIVPNIQIEKTCSLLNPGTGKGDNQINLWKKVGTCGKNKEGAFQGDCWIKLGELEKYNPEAYKEITENLCTGTICSQHQSCEGIQETTPVSGYKTVVCCKGTCKDDENYIRTVQTLEEQSFLKETAYKEMYNYGKSYCEGTEFSNNNPFSSSSSIPASWLEKRNDIEEIGRVSQEEKNNYYFFKGMLYLICGNCVDAPKEFNQISDKTSDYFIDACGKNEAASGGLMYDRCKKTCSGIPEKTTTPTTTGTTQVQPLKINSLTITSPPSSIDTNNLKIQLGIGGEYKIERVIFNRDVYKCQLKFGEQERKTVDNCEFKEPYTFFTAGITANSTLNILAYEKSDSETPYEFDFNVEILEKTVQDGRVLLCTDPTGTQAFCLHYSNYKDKRCSDFSYNKVNYKYVLDRTSSTSCNNECITRTECLTKNQPYYMTYDIINNNGILVK